MGFASPRGDSGVTSGLWEQHAVLLSGKLTPQDLRSRPAFRAAGTAGCVPGPVLPRSELSITLAHGGPPVRAPLLSTCRRARRRTPRRSLVATELAFQSTFQSGSPRPHAPSREARLGHGLRADDGMLPDALTTIPRPSAVRKARPEVSGSPRRVNTTAEASAHLRFLVLCTRVCISGTGDGRVKRGHRVLFVFFIERL